MGSSWSTAGLTVEGAGGVFFLRVGESDEDDLLDTDEDFEDRLRPLLFDGDFDLRPLANSASAALKLLLFSSGSFLIFLMMAVDDEDDAKFINRFCKGAVFRAPTGLSERRLFSCWLRLGIPSGVDDLDLDLDRDDLEDTDEDRRPRFLLLGLRLLDRLEDDFEEDLEDPDE